MLTDDDSEVHLDITVADGADGEGVRLALSGDLDLGGAAELESRLGDLGELVGSVVIDLSGVEFIDSSGIRTLIIARTQHSSRLVEPSRAVLHTFEVANVLHLLEEA